MRRWLWIQDYNTEGNNYFTQAGIDALLARTAGKFTDYVVAERQDTSALAWFNSSLMGTRSRRIGGLTAGQYYIQQAATYGRRVHLWLYTGYFGTFQEMYVPPLAAWSTQSMGTSVCRGDLDWLNFSVAGAREMVADVCQDFAEQNPGLAGVHLDYIRYHASHQDCPTYDEDQVADCIIRVMNHLRPATDLELTAAISGTYDHNEPLTFRPVDRMVEERLVDYMHMMSYTTRTVAQKRDYIENRLALLDGWEPHRMTPGLGSFDGLTSWNTQLANWTAGGYTHFCVFDNTTLTDAMLATLSTLPALDMDDHCNLPTIGAEHTDLSGLVDTMQAARVVAEQPYLQCLYTPTTTPTALSGATFDTARKPSDEADDWTEVGAADAFAGSLGQHYVDVYDGPQGAGYITGTRVEWNESTYRYEEHTGPETRSGPFDQWRVDLSG